MLARTEDAIEISPIDNLQVFQSHLAKACITRNACIVDERVDVTEIADNPFHTDRTRVIFRDIDHVAGKCVAFLLFSFRPLQGSVIIG